MSEKEKRVAELPWDEEVEFVYVRERVDWEDVICTTLSIIGAIVGAVLFVMYGG